MPPVARWLCFALVGLLGVGGCARVLRQPQVAPTPRDLRSLWVEPADLGQRDLYAGPGGRDNAPDAGPFTFIQRKSTGVNPGFDVADRHGVRWSVKLGREVQSEIAVSRILWAIGYHQPPTYYVPEWEMIGAVQGRQNAGRFRRETLAEDVVGEWSWYDNPFIGSQPFAGLIAVNLLFNNWDLKTANNKIYAVQTAAGVDRRFIVRDLGGSLGSSRQPGVLRWVPFMRYKQGSRNDLEDFERQPLIESVIDNDVQFSYRGIDGALADSVGLADLEWAAEMLSRLTNRQWSDAFLAAGYPPERARRYVTRIQQKLSEVRAIRLRR